MKDVFADDARVIGIIAFSLLASFLINIGHVFLGTQTRHSDYVSKKQEIGIGFALMAVEDAIMLPVNFVAVLGTTEDSGVEGLVDFIAVCISAAVGMLAFFFKFTTGLSEVCCGSRGYEFDPEIIIDFIDREDRENLDEKGCCNGFQETLLQGCSKT